MVRIRELIGEWRDSGMIWWLLFAILALSARDVIWPASVWFRRHLVAIGCPPGYTWVASAIYFSFWIWLLVFLAQQGKRHPGMILDTICGGLLSTVAAALHELPVRTALAGLGFGAAAWVTSLCTVALVAARSVQHHEGQPPQQQ
jgi:hypothetical protein